MNNLVTRIASRFAVIGALFCIASVVILYYIDRHPLLIDFLLDIRFVLYTVFIIFSIRAFREENQKALQFHQGMSVGMMCYILIALMTSLFIWAFAELEQTGFLADYISKASERLEANKEQFVQGLGAETYEKALADLPGTGAFTLAVDYFLKSMPIGLFLTIIVSVILRKQPQTKL